MSRKLADLPIEILVDILLRLPAKSLCQIRCVSKTFNNAVDNPAFVTLHTCLQAATSNAAAEVPQLILAARHSHKYTESTWGRIALQPKKHWAYDTEEEAMTSMRIKPITLHYIQFFSNHEMFVFHNLVCFQCIRSTVDCFLVDPLRRQVLELPSSNDVHFSMLSGDSIWYGMGFADTTNVTHKIVRVISNPELDSVVAHVLELGTTSWRKIDSVPPCGLCFPERSVSAFGDAHWLRDEIVKRGECIISFDFKKEEFHWTPYPNIEHKMNMKLLALKRSMSIMAFTDASRSAQIWMMKDYSTKEWTLDYTINLHSYYNDFRRASIVDEWEHGIYIAERWYFVNEALLLDLRSGDIVGLELSSAELRDSEPLQQPRHMFSCTGSLLSLKKYGKIQETCSFAPRQHEK